MIIDSHCHLDYPSLYENLEEVVKRAEFNKVNKLLTICTTLESFEKIKLIIEKYKNIYGTFGIHPHETKKLAFDTIELNRQFDSDNQNLTTFVPFHGTPLRRMCEDLGLIKPETITKCATNDAPLVMEQYPPEEIAAIRKCFALYIKFPKNRWKEIEKAEKNDKEGNKIYDNLREEYLTKYMPKPDADPHGASKDFGKIENMNIKRH